MIKRFLPYIKLNIILLVAVYLFWFLVLMNDSVAEAASHYIYPWLMNYIFYSEHSFFLAYLPAAVVGNLIMLGIRYYAQRRAKKEIDNVVEAIDSIITEPDKEIVLAAPYENAEIRLNSLRLENARNRYLAKEAEQRKNDLVVYLAHDLKTPLTSVIGYLSLLAENQDFSPEQREKFTSIAIEKAYRLEDLINEFFDITRFNLQSFELEERSLNIFLLVTQIVDEFYPNLQEKGLTVETDIGNDLQIVGDSDKIARVFSNIMRNAISYSYSNTVIKVSAGKTEGKVVIIFSNEGDTIPPQKLNRIFEKFFRLDSARNSNSGGAGLGLAIAKEILEMHNGTITAVSENNNTRFIVELPSQA